MSEQSQQDLQRAEEARSFLVPRVQKFMDRARNADTATLTAQIYYFLQSLGAEEALQKLTDGLRACGDLPNADEALREWNVITELLDQMVHLLPAGEPITQLIMMTCSPCCCAPRIWGIFRKAWTA